MRKQKRIIDPVIRWMPTYKQIVGNKKPYCAICGSDKIEYKIYRETYDNRKGAIIIKCHGHGGYMNYSRVWLEELDEKGKHKPMVDVEIPNGEK